MRTGFTDAGICIEEMKEGLETKHKNTQIGLRGEAISGLIRDVKKMCESRVK